MGRLVQKQPDSRRKHSGAAMTGSGAVLGATGLAAGGIPGAKEPNSLKVWHLRGKPRSKEWASPSNLAHNIKTVAPLPRSGILGFRADMHDAYIKDETKNSRPKNAYERGLQSGKLDTEKKVVRGMRMGRKATHSLTFGGAALGVAGLHRMNSKGPVKKRDRERGGAAGTAGAVTGGTAGAYAGARLGPEVTVGLVDRSINRAYEKEHGVRVGPRQSVHGGNSFPRRAKALTRGLKGGALVGTAALGTGGYRVARGEKVTKASKSTDRRQTASAAAVGAGGTTAAVGHLVPKGLARFERHYSNSAKDHILQAQQLAPHFGGLETTPAKVNGFGVVTRHPKTTMYPEKTGRQLRAEGAINRIKSAAVREQVGRHRGAATQERHFAEVFNSTGKGIRRLRNPGLAVAAAGGTGLWASKDVKKRAYGYEEHKTSPLRVAEAAVGLAGLGWGGSRLGMVKSTLRAGSKRPGNAGINFRRAEKARQAIEDKSGVGAKMLGEKINAPGFRLRPAEAAIGGGLLLNNSIPVSRRKFTPIDQGW